MSVIDRQWWPGLLRLETRGYLWLILSEATSLISRMAYCNRLAIIFARGWRRIAWNQSGWVMTWGDFGGNRVFGGWPEKGKWVTGIAMPYAIWQVSLFSDISIYRFIDWISNEHIFISWYVDLIISLYDDASLARFLLVSFFILSKKIYWHITWILYSLSRDVRGCPLYEALRIISQMLFETKKLFALVKCQCEIELMNKQIHALKIKLASLKDAKKIAVLKIQ